MRALWVFVSLLLAGCTGISPSLWQESAMPDEAGKILPIERVAHTSEPEPVAPAEVEAPPAQPSAPVRDVRPPTEWRGDRRTGGEARIAHARNTKGAVVKQLFEDAGVAFPADRVLFRVFKQEAELEIWAGGKDDDLALVATYGICAASGGPGPKRREGDLQVPEGFYKIGYYDPTSAFHLAMLVDYPNASDKIRGGPQPGGDILIHGSCASIGCMAMSDERIDEIFFVGWSAFMKGRPVDVHIFPARDFDALIADEKYAEHHAFWREIKVGHDAFEKTHRVPVVTIASDGNYVVAGHE